MTKTRAKALLVGSFALLCTLGRAEALDVTPGDPTIGVGQTQQFMAGGVAAAAALALGGFHSCALLADGTVQCWGRNDNGQLANGTTELSTTPTDVSGLAGVTALVAGGFHTCTLLVDGTVWCWGLNDSGQLGNGTATRSAAPLKVVGIGPAIAISAGGFHTCVVLADGTVWCWGLNNFGQLGNGTGVGNSTLFNSATPTEVVGISKATAVTGGGYHTCALLVDDTVWCWGRNDGGQLGNGTFTPAVNLTGTHLGGSQPVPTEVSGITTAVAVSAGFLHTCALLADGTLRCWGYNSFGELGDGTTTWASTPTQVVGIGAAAAVAAGGYHTCAQLADGAVWCWGRNDSGQLGNGTTTQAISPIQVLGVSGVGLATGHMFTCPLRADGAVQCWGQNDSGELGDGTTTDSASPVLVAGSRLTWGSSDTTVATIDAAGLATGRSPGSTAITAASWSRSGSTTLTVVP